MDVNDLSSTQYNNWVKMGRPNIDNPGGSMMHQIDYGPYKPISYFSPSPSSSPSYTATVSHTYVSPFPYPLLNKGKRKDHGTVANTVANSAVPSSQNTANPKALWKKGASILKPFVVNAVKVSTHPIGASLLAYEFFYSSLLPHGFSGPHDFFVLSLFYVLPVALGVAAFRKAARVALQKPRTLKNGVKGGVMALCTAMALYGYAVAYQEDFFVDRWGKSRSQKGGPTIMSETTANVDVPLIKPKAVRLPKEAYKKTAHYRARRLAQASKQPRP